MMSLDVSLTIGDDVIEKCPHCDGSGFVNHGPREVYEANITHNLNRMAGEAGIYKHLWRPDEIGITKARQLIEPLRRGVELLRSDPDRFKQFNPENGWGDYDGLVNWVQGYLCACEDHPEADVRTYR